MPKIQRYLTNVASCKATENTFFCSPGFTHCWDGNLTGKFVMKSGDEVVCNKGWLVFQRRFDGSVDFQAYWSDYRNGFGSLNGEFWWGLEKMHIATKPFQCNQCRLRVELKDIDNETSYAEYSEFGVGPESTEYQCCVGGQYTGTAGDSMISTLAHHSANGVGFSTRDRDNDNSPHQHCADFSRREGGWWFNDCSFAIPWKTYPGCPKPPQYPCHAHWFTYKNSIRLIGTELKFRCDISIHSTPSLFHLSSGVSNWWGSGAT
uniref:Ficolin-1-like n=1 Tax=Phallusia mammillata TaxID=59560 RepID=A0A6F9DC43_9ASCI|nr:ficolin-1-like [Phallusia mammillata]